MYTFMSELGELHVFYSSIIYSALYQKVLLLWLSHSQEAYNYNYGSVVLSYFFLRLVALHCCIPI